jgi:hypothetical protein
VDGSKGQRAWIRWNYGKPTLPSESAQTDHPQHITQSAILASLFASAFTWPFVPSDAHATLGCWFGGLMLILGSIATATQQCITLYRYSTLGDPGMENLKTMLNGSLYLSVYVWQLPVMMLRFGIIAFVVGLFLLLWQASVFPVQIAISFTVLGGFWMANHVLSVAFCYFRDPKARRGDVTLLSRS